MASALIPSPPVPPPLAAAPRLAAPAPPQPGHSAALLAQLLLDGLVAPETTAVEVRLSDHEFVVNGQQQSVAQRARYCQFLGLAGGSAIAICLRAGH